MEEEEEDEEQFRSSGQRRWGSGWGGLRAGIATSPVWLRALPSSAASSDCQPAASPRASAAAGGGGVGAVTATALAPDTIPSR